MVSVGVIPVVVRVVSVVREPVWEFAMVFPGRMPETRTAMRTTGLTVEGLFIVAFGKSVVQCHGSVADLGRDGLHHALEAVARADAPYPIRPSVGLGEMNFLLMNHLVQHFDPITEELELGYLLFKNAIRILRDGLVVFHRLQRRTVNSGKGGRSFDVGDPDGRHLLEAKEKAQILDTFTVDRIDSEVQQLLLRLAVPHDADDIPVCNNSDILVYADQAITSLRESLPVDGQVGVATSIFGLVHIQTESLE